MNENLIAAKVAMSNGVVRRTDQCAFQGRVFPASARLQETLERETVIEGREGPVFTSITNRNIFR